MNVFIFTTKADTNAKGDPIVIIEENISNKNIKGDSNKISTIHGRSISKK